MNCIGFFVVTKCVAPKKGVENQKKKKNYYYLGHDMEYDSWQFMILNIKVKKNVLMTKKIQNKVDMPKLKNCLLNVFRGQPQRFWREEKYQRIKQD